MRKILIFLLCFCTVFVCFVIPSFAVEGVPTDITGFTVTVPAGWDASAGFGIFNIYGTFTTDRLGTNDFSSLYLGYVLNFETFTRQPSSDALTFGDYSSTVPSSEAISFTFTDGSDVSNSTLIQWFVNNNATFISSEPTTYTLSSGFYNLATLPSEGVPSVGGFTPNIEHLFEVPVELHYSTGVVKAYNYFGFMVTSFTDSQNFSVDFTVQLLDIGSSIRIANLTATDGVCTSQFYGGISRIYFGEDIVTDEESYQLISFMFELDSSYIPVEPDIPDITINPWGYLLEMIIEALKVPLFGYFSVWDIFITICGIFILMWLLKLLAGG